MTPNHEARHQDAEIAVAAVSHLLSTYIAAWMRWERGANVAAYSAAPTPQPKGPAINGHSTEPASRRMSDSDLRRQILPRADTCSSRVRCTLSSRAHVSDASRSPRSVSARCSTL